MIYSPKTIKETTFKALISILVITKLNKMIFHIKYIIIKIVHNVFDI